MSAFAFKSNFKIGFYGNNMSVAYLTIIYVLDNKDQRKTQTQPLSVNIGRNLPLSPALN